jgi:endoglucanase
MGAMIARGPTLNKHVTDLLGDVAEAEGIAHAFEVYSRTTSTDADEIHLVRAGVPTGLLSIPTRYLHSPNEMCDLDDVEAIVALVVAFAKKLARDHSFIR